MLFYFCLYGPEQRRGSVLANIQTFSYNDSEFFWKPYYQLTFLLSLVHGRYLGRPDPNLTLTRLQGAISAEGPAQKFAGL